jgi:hypothetical protein
VSEGADVLRNAVPVRGGLAVGNRYGGGREQRRYLRAQTNNAAGEAHQAEESAYYQSEPQMCPAGELTHPRFHHRKTNNGVLNLDYRNLSIT